MTRNRTLIVVLLLVSVAAGLRFHEIASEDLWLDEVHTYNLVNRSVADMFLANWNHTPLYFLFIHQWAEAIGDTALSLRFPSFVFGVLVVFIMFFATRRLTGVRTALLTTFLMAICVFHIHYSQDARPYALLALFSALALWQFVRFLERPSILNSALLILANLFALYTHFYGVFMMFAQNGFVLLLYFMDRRFQATETSAYGGELRAPRLIHWIAIQAVIIASFFPWLVELFTFVDQYGDQQVGLAPPPLKKIIGPFVTYSGSFVLLGVYGLLAAVPVVILRNRRVLLLLFWIFVPLFVSFIGAHLFMPQAYITRYMIGSSLAFYVLVAWGIALLPKRAGLIAIGIVTLLGLHDLRVYYTTSNKAPWKESTRVIADHYVDGDLMVFHSSAGILPFLHYWPESKDRIKEFPPKDHYLFHDLLDSLATSIQPESRIWYVESYGRDPQGKIRAIVSEGRTTQFERRWSIVNSATGKSVSIDARLYERKQGAAP